MRDLFSSVRVRLLLALIVLSSSVPAAEPLVPVAYRLNPSDDTELRACIEKAVQEDSDLRLDMNHPLLLLDLALHRNPDGKSAWLSVAMSRVFDNHGELNTWMRSFREPLPYAAKESLRSLTYGLMRPMAHWIEPVSLPLDCAPILANLHKPLAELPYTGN